MDELIDQPIKKLKSTIKCISITEAVIFLTALLSVIYFTSQPEILIIMFLVSGSIILAAGLCLVGSQIENLCLLKAGAILHFVIAGMYLLLLMWDLVRILKDNSINSIKQSATMIIVMAVPGTFSIELRNRLRDRQTVQLQNAVAEVTISSDNVTELQPPESNDVSQSADQ